MQPVVVATDVAYNPIEMFTLDKNRPPGRDSSILVQRLHIGAPWFVVDWLPVSMATLVDETTTHVLFVVQLMVLLLASKIDLLSRFWNAFLDDSSLLILRACKLREYTLYIAPLS